MTELQSRKAGETQPESKYSWKDKFLHLVEKAPKPDGEPRRIIEYCPENKGKRLRLNKQELKKILKKVGKRKVVVLSISGAFRTGKSFLLNLLLRHLEYLETGDKSHEDKYKNASLGGFDWSPGSEKVTSGLLMWNRPFFIRVPVNQGKTEEPEEYDDPGLSEEEEEEDEIAVLLMDTHGLFDDETPTDVASLFVSLSVLISSIQIYNVKQLIGENHLQSLELFANTASLGVKLGEGVPPFQRLIFLIRDWCDPGKHDFGDEGGKDYLEEKLQTKAEGLHVVRESIGQAFQNLDCFLMASPGDKAQRTLGQRELKKKKEVFSGKMEDLSEGFIECLDDLLRFIIDPKTLRNYVKRIGKAELGGDALLQHIVSWVALFQDGKLPTPTSTVQTLLDQRNRQVLKKCIIKYKADITKMLKKLREKGADIEEVKSSMDECKTAILEWFEKKRKGTASETKSQQEALERVIEETTETVTQQYEAHLKGKEESEVDKKFQEAKEKFERSMSKICSEDSKYMKDDKFDEEFASIKRSAVDAFQDGTRHLRSVSIWNDRKEALVVYCDKKKELYQKKNKINDPETVPEYKLLREIYDLKILDQKKYTWKNIFFGIITLGVIPMLKKGFKFLVSWIL